MMRYTGERAIPWNEAVGWVMDQHVQRYAWALQFCHGKRVADLGCGTGYGSFMLSWVASYVVGLDVSVLSIDFARDRFQADNLDYLTGDITAQVTPADVTICFEVLEHLDYPNTALAHVKGTLIWSIPVEQPGGFHARGYTAQEAESAFGGDIWYQSKAGYIVPKISAQFKPHNVLGVR
jgi:SAM-dependent methyltransferase